MEPMNLDLPSHQKALRDGEFCAIVQITKKGRQDEHLAIKIVAWQIDEEGDPILAKDGTRVEIPAKIHTILESAIAEGTESVMNAYAQQTAEAFERLKKHATALKVWDMLPGGDA